MLFLRWLSSFFLWLGSWFFGVLRIFFVYIWLEAANISLAYVIFLKVGVRGKSWYLGLWLRYFYPKIFFLILYCIDFHNRRLLLLVLLWWYRGRFEIVLDHLERHSFLLLNLNLLFLHLRALLLFNYFLNDYLFVWEMFLRWLVNLRSMNFLIWIVYRINLQVFMSH